MPDRAVAVSYATSGSTALYGFVTAQNIGILIGALCAITTAAVSVWAKVREDRRQQRLADARLAAQQAQIQERR